MKKNQMKYRVLGLAVTVAAVVAIFALFGKQLSFAFARAAVISAARLMPSAAITVPASSESGGLNGIEQETTGKAASQVNAKAMENSFFETPQDIKELSDKAAKNAGKDKKDGAIREKQYVNDAVTDQYGAVRLKNTNKTKIDLKKILNERADLSVRNDKPAVLIFHTHTTEAYQLLDRNFYAVGYVARSTDSARNMVRIGDEIAAQLEKNGFSCIHDKTIHDAKYNGAYTRSRETVIKYLKKYPSIQVVLDIHRDAIELADGTKIKPTAVIGGKKAAQVMIISGCQEEGNGIEDFKDWRYNLVFAAALQQSMETNFPGLTRPIFFCPRRYNMNLTRNSLLLEVGSDANTLGEAALSGRCIGEALSQLLEKYVEG